MKFYKIMTDEGQKRKFAYATGFCAIDEKIDCSVFGREWFRSLWFNENYSFNLVLSRDNFRKFLEYILGENGL